MKKLLQTCTRQLARKEIKRLMPLVAVPKPFTARPFSTAQSFTSSIFVDIDDNTINLNEEKQVYK